MSAITTTHADEERIDSYVPPAANPALPSYHDEKSPPPYNRLLDHCTDTEKKLTYAEAFRVEGPVMTRFHEIWATILFAVVVAGFLGVSVCAVIYSLSDKFVRLQRSKDDQGSKDNQGSKDDQRLKYDMFYLETSEILSLTLGNFGIIVALLPFILLLIIKFTGPFIRISFMLLIGSYLVNSVLSLTFLGLAAQRNISPPLIFYGCCNLVLAAALIIWFLRWASKIPFSVLMLRASSDVAWKYKKVFVVSLLGGLAAIAITFWYTFIFVLLISTISDEQSKGVVWGLTIYISFAYYWITEVLKNVIHVTISGVYAGWFFRPRELPSKATRSAFGRAMTYSFGSISFGSLGVAVTTTIQLCSENMYFKFIAILLRGILSMFNEYAFSYLAIFNTSYCSAAKTTSRIMRDRAIVLLVNQCLVNAALVSGAFFVGSICCFYSLLLIACNVVKTDTSVTLVMLIPLWTFFVAFQCCSVVLSPIRSGVTTIFVGMALEPEVMKKEHQELYGSMVKFYPQLEKAVV